MIVAAGLASLGLAGLGLVYGVPGAPGHADGAYLAGYLYWLGLSLGALMWIALHRLTGGRWGEVALPAWRAAVAGLPVLLLLFVPIALRLSDLYPWAAGTWKGHGFKAAYLDPELFVVRAAIYFGVWLVVARVCGRGRGLAGVALVSLVLTFTFAAIDFAMSRDPSWSSTVYGLIFVTSAGLGGLALAVVGGGLEPTRASPRRRHEVGKLMFAFVLLWAYAMLSQFLIIWMGNLPEEAGWYLARSSPGWDVAVGILITAQLAVPFAVLLGRGAKRSYRVLWGVALLLLVSRAVEIFWLVAPDTNGHGALPGWRDVVALLAVGAVWCAPVIFRLRRSEA